MKALHSVTFSTVAGTLMYAALGISSASAQTPQGAASPCQPGQDLLTMPEIRSVKGKLRGEITVTSGSRTLWGSAGDTRCVSQDIRYLKGRDLQKTGPEDPAFAKGEPIPGPTLRAQVGDLIQIRFQNHVDPQAFATTLDQNTVRGNTTGCDEVRSESGLIYPNPTGGGTVGDAMPNCLHGSSTTNLHFHGTHTTPNTTGDNILLFVRPALRDGATRKIVGPNPALVEKMFNQIWLDCEKSGSPTTWKRLPAAWTADQERLLRKYDRETPFKGQPGPLPLNMQIWPPNKQQIDAGFWPQYQMGAFPYCFRLADAKRNRMGQSPGTHWYHAHKHGSTALNVANGMTGAFIIEGQYDADLRKFYGKGFRDQVLMIQQLSTTPFPLLNPATAGPNTVAKPQFSVNGRLNPVVTMRPGEVQLWRMINGAFRDAVLLQSFEGEMAWRQIAQDGVQFAFGSYQSLGTVNNPLNLAPANRADLLVKAPVKPGRYALTVQPNAGLPLQCLQGQPGCVNGISPKFFSPQASVTLLTVNVTGDPLSPAQDFIQNQADFPSFPGYLADIPKGDVQAKERVVNFGAAHNLIDGDTFDQDKYQQTMMLNTAEQWKVTNAANDKAHPFHIHVNPFQIIEVFAPNAENTTDPQKPCYIDPMNPATWKPCTTLQGPFVWWDTFAIPTAKTYNVTANCNGGKVNGCPEPIRQYVTCSSTACTLTIPGHFRMRSRFVDFAGSYVLHCHILIHEDRGMMQLVRVVNSLKNAPVKPPYSHH